MDATAMVGAEYWASFWEWIGDKAFIIVVVALAVEYITGSWAKPHRGALEDARKLQIAELSKETVRLRAEGDQARAAIAAADARAAEANQKAAEAQVALEQFKAPRWIVDERSFVGHLQQFQDVSVDVWLIHAPSADAAPFAGRLLDLLKSAQWSANGVFNLMGGMSGSGIMVATRITPTANDQAAAYALINELGLHGLTSELGTIVTDNPVGTLGGFVGPNATNPPANLWVIVGSKP